MYFLDYCTPLQMIPLYTAKEIIADLEKHFSRSIWHKKKPRINLSKIQLPVDKVGLALPDLGFYNWACYIRIILRWLQQSPETEIDSWFVSPFSLHSVITAKQKPTGSGFCNNPLLQRTLNTWRNIQWFWGKIFINADSSYYEQSPSPWASKRCFPLMGQSKNLVNIRLI